MGTNFSRRKGACAVLLLFAGTAFISPAQTLTTLANFNWTNGANPNSGSLVQGADGNFYGVTQSGGHNNQGTVFKITPVGALTTLHSFSGDNDGGQPEAGLIQATDGNFYGTTLSGGNWAGTVFKITPGGTLTTLYSFSGGTDGIFPDARLVQATDGNFYGTTTGGTGTIFKITSGGTLTTLYTFSGTDGLDPLAGLIQATDGNFYGTTVEGGAKNQGTIFRITPAGTLTTLNSFSGGVDAAPWAGAALIQATDGNFYGTTYKGGAYNVGTVFKITPGGTLTTLYSFGLTETDGDSPLAGLIQAIDGNFYGTTSEGGAYGTVFKITPGGTVTTLYSFSAAGGTFPVAGLVQGTDGNLYGTTNAGGASNDGTVFRLQLMLPPASQLPAITLVQNAEGGSPTIAPNTWIAIKGSNLAPAGDTRIWRASDFVNNEMPMQLDGVGVKINGAYAYMYYISPTQLNVLTPPDVPLGPGSAEVTVTTGGVSASFTAQAQQESPSFFIFGAGPYVIGTHLDGTLIGPTSLYPGQSTPAHPGEVVILYANGFGAISPPVAAGSEVQSGSLPALPLIQIGGMPAVVQFAGLVSPGLYQFNIVVPSSAPAGDDAITATYSRSSTQAGAMLTVQP